MRLLKFFISIKKRFEVKISIDYEYYENKIMFFSKNNGNKCDKWLADKWNSCGNRYNYIWYTLQWIPINMINAGSLNPRLIESISLIPNQIVNS